MSRLWRTAIAFFVVFAVAAPVQQPAHALEAINGAGSSFAALEIDSWRADVSHAPYNLSVDFTAAGSTFGRNQYIDGKVDFGATDIQFEDQNEIDNLNRTPRKNFVYVPVSAGGLGFMFNVTGADGRRIENLKLSPANVCRLFTEATIYWDDPAVAAENPGVPLPHQPVVRVVRADGAGQSFVFMDFCISAAPGVWNSFVDSVLNNSNSRDTASLLFKDHKPSSQWPQGYGASSPVAPAAGSDGVANRVADGVTGKYSVTFVEAGFAKVRHYPVALVKNGGGAYTSPLDASAVSIALAYARGRDDGTFELAYLAQDAKAYFPSTYSYVIAQTTGADPAKGASLGTFLNYSVTYGQKNAELLGYARLSTVLVNLALDQVQKLPGAPERPTDLAGAPAPPDVTAGLAGAEAAAGSAAATAGVGSADAAVAGTGTGETDQAAALGLSKRSSADSAGSGPASGKGISGSDILWLMGIGMIVAAIATASSGRFGGSFGGGRTS